MYRRIYVHALYIYKLLMRSKFNVHKSRGLPK